jgi:hypothetical protein
MVLDVWRGIEGGKLRLLYPGLLSSMIWDALCGFAKKKGF